MAPQLSKLERETTGLKLFPLFTLLGWILIGFSILVFVIVLAPTATSYWGGNAKAVRDTAPAFRGVGEPGGSAICGDDLDDREHCSTLWLIHSICGTMAVV